jgi:VanZ family protein
MLKLIKFLRPFARYLLISWALTVIIVSSIPDIPTMKIHTSRADFRIDYFLHFCEYGLLTFLTFLSFAGTEFRLSFRRYLIISTSLIVFAFLDEYHQKLIPGRSYNIHDFFSNVTGILVIIIFTIFVFRAIRNGKKVSEF